MVNVDLYSAIITKVSNALNTLVSGEKPGFQALSKGLIVLLCAEVVRQRVPDHGAVHSKCWAPSSGQPMSAPPECYFQTNPPNNVYYFWQLKAGLSPHP